MSSFSAIYHRYCDTHLYIIHRNIKKEMASFNRTQGGCQKSFKRERSEESWSKCSPCKGGEKGTPAGSEGHLAAAHRKCKRRRVQKRQQDKPGKQAGSRPQWRVLFYVTGSDLHFTNFTLAAVEKMDW